MDIVLNLNYGDFFIDNPSPRGRTTMIDVISFSKVVTISYKGFFSLIKKMSRWTNQSIINQNSSSVNRESDQHADPVQTTNK